MEKIHHDYYTQVKPKQRRQIKLGDRSNPPTDHVLVGFSLFALDLDLHFADLLFSPLLTYQPSFYRSVVPPVFMLREIVITVFCCTCFRSNQPESGIFLSPNVDLSRIILLSILPGRPLAI